MIFEDLSSAIKWAKETYPGSSFSVKAQPDGPTIVSIKTGKKILRTLVYIKKEEEVGI